MTHQKLANPWYWNIKLAVNSSGPIMENAGKISAKKPQQQQNYCRLLNSKEKDICKKNLLKLNHTRERTIAIMKRSF